MVKITEIMKKIDFTVKGTRLPQIPNDTKFSSIMNANNKQPFHLTVSSIIDNLVSYGVIEIDNVVCVKADKSSYNGKNHLIFRLSDLERLAEEQGMYKEEDDKKLIGYKLKPECEKYSEACGRIVRKWRCFTSAPDTVCDCRVDTTALNSIKEAGVLHWFDEVYEEPVKEMTHEEIEKELGYKIRIVEP